LSKRSDNARLAPAIGNGLAADRTTLIHVPIAFLGPADR
jgi:hypothetical protein